MENFENEIWMDILNYEGYYQGSNYGRIKSLERWIIREDGYRNHIEERIIKPHIINSGYLCVCLHKNGTKNHLVHRF